MEWLEATGLADFAPITLSYRPGENERSGLPQYSTVPISAIRPPKRAPGVPGLQKCRAISIMRAIANGTALPPIEIYAQADGPFTYRVGHGFHRYTIAKALGFSAIPGTIIEHWEPWMTGDQ